MKMKEASSIFERHPYCNATRISFFWRGFNGSVYPLEIPNSTLTENSCCWSVGLKDTGHNSRAVRIHQSSPHPLTPPPPPPKKMHHDHPSDLCHLKVFKRVYIAFKTHLKSRSKRVSNTFKSRLKRVENPFKTRLKRALNA